MLYKHKVNSKCEEFSVLSKIDQSAIPNGVFSDRQHVIQGRGNVTGMKAL